MCSWDFRITCRPPLPLADPFPRRILGDPPLTAVPLVSSLTTSSATRHLLADLTANFAEFGRTRQDPRVLRLAAEGRLLWRMMAACFRPAAAIA